MRRGQRNRETGSAKRDLVKCVPVEQQQQRQHGQIGGGDVGVLLETHEDNDDQCGWNDVVTLQETKNRLLLPHCIYEYNNCIMS